MNKEISITSDLPEGNTGGPPEGAQQIGLVPCRCCCSWPGVASCRGLLEVGVILLRKHVVSADQLLQDERALRLDGSAHQSRDFPLLGTAALALVPGAIAAWPLARHSRAWLRSSLLPACWAAFPWIHGLAVLLVVLGIAVRLVPMLERRAAGLRRFIVVSFPGVAATGGDPGIVGLGAALDRTAP